VSHSGEKSGEDRSVRSIKVSHKKAQKAHLWC
jgi:hypothetical protein